MANKSDSIEREIRRKIHSGEWPAAMRIPSEDELCGEFQVSRTTIRAALNNLRSERLLISRPKIGTLVSSIAGRQTIVILGRQEDIMAPFGYWYRDLASHVCDAVRDAGYNPMLVMGFGETSSETVDTFETYYASALRSAVGIVVISTVTAEIEAYLNGNGMPPWTGVSYGTSPLPNTVFADYNQLYRQAVKIFLDHGIDRFATIYFTLEGLPEEDQHSWRDALIGRMLGNNRSGSPDDYLIKVPYSEHLDNIRQVFEQWWKRPNRPGAIFFSDDALFDAVSHYLVELNIRIPEDLAILTLANVGRNFLFPKSMDRIGQNPQLITGKLLDLLFINVNNREKKDVVSLAEWQYQPGKSLPTTEIVSGGRRRTAVKI